MRILIRRLTKITVSTRPIMIAITAKPNIATTTPRVTVISGSRTSITAIRPKKTISSLRPTARIPLNNQGLK